MQANKLSSFKPLYDMNVEGGHSTATAGTHGDHTECRPRIFGPPTNYTFKKMVPMVKFLENMEENHRPWLRIYDADEEEARLELKARQKHEHTDALANRYCNKEWPQFLQRFLAQGDKQCYAKLSKLLKYGIQQNE